MATVDDEMLQRANPILERYRATLFATGQFHASGLERELKEVWGGNWQGLKPLMVSMSEHGRYQEVAAYYMEHSNPTGPASEFKRHLAALYGVDSFHAKDLDEKRAAYWQRALPPREAK